MTAVSTNVDVADGVPPEERPIPKLPSVDGWESVPFDDAVPVQEMVALGPFGEFSDIATSGVYAGESADSPYTGDASLSGTVLTAFVRRGVADRLRVAQRLLPARHHLVVTDAYRPRSVQTALYEHYFASLRARHPSWSDEALAAETQKYVSVPSDDPDRPPPHNTGGSVDAIVVVLPPAPIFRRTCARMRRCAALTTRR